MKTETKVIGGIVLVTVAILVGSVWLLSAQSAKEQKKLSKPLIGQEITVWSRNHLPQGSKIDYSTNPPVGGNHYPTPQAAGIYDSPPQDQVDQLKQIYDSASVSKKIMVSRNGLDVPIALTSWGRLLKLQTIDRNQILAFMETNEGRGPEQAPL